MVANPRSPLDLRRRFSTMEECRDFLFGLRFPDGWLCSCGGQTFWWRSGTKIRCRTCSRDRSVLAGTIFHEMAHQLLYVNDDSMFNESYAVAVEREGMRRWLAVPGRPDLAAASRAGEQRREDFVTLVLAARDRLAVLYASDRSDAEKLQRKADIFDQIRADYRVLRVSWDGYGGYDRWFAQDLNNANLASIATYNAIVPAVDALLASVGGDMAAFHAAAEALGGLPKTERDAALARLAAGTG